MVNPNIEKYLTDTSKNNWSYQDYEKALINAGWKKSDITDTLSSHFKIPTPSTVSGSSTMWDSFEHILMFISLYVMTFSIVSILYSFIDKWAPGIDSIYYSKAYSSDNWLLRSSLSALIVSFPLFGYFFLDITKRTLINPNIKALTTRKLLTYLTLIVTFSISLGYVISLINSLLGGNVTVNFVLKFLSVNTAIGIIFLYYLTQVKEDRKVF